jgi:tetratricopeptide (TPR) repeat protein
MTTLGLSMIVRDAAALLPACLESARAAVDEIVMADTGSKDSTMAIARQFGARVISVPWANDFAKARNRALEEMKSDWVLVLDADEQLDAEAAEQIRSLLGQNVSGFMVTIRNYVASLEERVWDRAAKPNDGLLPSSEPYPGYVEHENVRLFRRDKEIYFVGCVHESVGPRIQQLARKLAPAPFLIHHFGMVADAETRARKNRFYRELGREKIRELPRNAQAHLELGLVELDNFRNLPDALALFERACQLNSQFGVAWFFQGLTLLKLERFSAALDCLAEAWRCGHRTALVAETKGDALYNLKDFSWACESYEIALRRDRGNPNIESKLGLALVRAGKTPDGLDSIRRAIAKRPASRELHDRLILALVWLDRIAEAGNAAEEKLKSAAGLEAGDHLRTASIWAKVRSTEKAAAVLREGLRQYPGHLALSKALEEVVSAGEGTELANHSNSRTSRG